MHIEIVPYTAHVSIPVYTFYDHHVVARQVRRSDCNVGLSAFIEFHFGVPQQHIKSLSQRVKICESSSSFELIRETILLIYNRNGNHRLSESKQTRATFKLH